MSHGPTERPIRPQSAPHSAPHRTPQQPHADKSLADVHATVATHEGASFWRRLFAFTGPAFMVSVGYMDPGNWATDLAGGARFGYQLIWVILLSNMMAILLQTLSARLGLATGRDLAQACRDHYPRPVTWVLWVICEIAIAACDLAEVLGSAIGLNLLFHIPILWGVLITAFDVILLLMLQSYGIRKIEAFILVLVATIGGCFAVEMFLSKPPLGETLKGFIPGALSGDSLYIAIGIIGATVMPHNLYLHSALVQSRAVEQTSKGIRQAARFNFIDSVVALNAAFFVNAAILMLAAAAFHTTGHTEVATLQEAHSLLAPLLGTVVAPMTFAIALLAAGQSSTITGTLAGQIVMEGFMHIRLRPWLRRLITRLIAIIPAVVVISWKGDAGVDPLLILSQVILSLQLSFAIVPLIHFTRHHGKMGELATPLWAHAGAWAVAVIIIGLNGKLVFDTMVEGWSDPGGTGLLVRYLLLPAVAVLVPLLCWMIVEPAFRRWKEAVMISLEMPKISVRPSGKPKRDPLLAGQYKRIGVAIEAAAEDAEILAGVIPLALATGAELVLIHCVESATARFIGDVVDDEEARADLDYLTRLRDRIISEQLTCRIRIGAGEPENEIARIAHEEKLDLIVTGGHGHALIGDIVHGSTVSELRHLTKIPVLSLSTTKPPHSR